ncbi:MAG: DUF1329 domain-containing protein [Alphaproteobacteria bacterium]|nr:DUF1329 domain-containing protein [Alphaproteobacteria bacterium]
MTFKSVLALSLLVFALGAPLALAKVTKEQAERLGEDLTPLGAEVAGEGDVPAWTGGLTGVPEGIVFDPKTQHPPNPFPDDKIKYTITSENMTEYDAVLTDGHKSMLKRVPGFKMNVYQSRRSCTVPKFVQKATKRNATTVELTADGERVTGGGSMGTPFPIPQSAKELMWNHRLRYVPYRMHRQLASIAVKKGKPTEIIKYDDASWNGWTDPDWKDAVLLGRWLLRKQSAIVRKPTPPVKLSRPESPFVFHVILTHGPIDGSQSDRKAWAYNSDMRRIRRAPDIAYDSPGVNTSNLSTVDAFGGFDGALDRFDWLLIGRSVKVVPYNSYSVMSTKYDDLVQPDHLSADFVRYEPHRVWTVEARLREGDSHIYQRRVLHLDEDMQAMVAGELYDSRGRLWRVQELHTVNFYQVPVCLPIAELVYDVRAPGTYLAQSLSNEQKPVNIYGDGLGLSCFTPEGMVELSSTSGGSGGDGPSCFLY